MKEVQEVCFWEINAKDGPSLAEFYSGVFDWKPEHEALNDYFSFETSSEGSGINGGIFTGKGKVPTHLTFYIRVDDIRDVVERVKRLGGEVLQEPFEVPNGGTIAVFRDLESNIVGVVQRKKSS